MKFQPTFRVCLISTYDLANFKASGITPWKNILHTKLPGLLQDVLTTFTVQNKLAAVAPKETITHHFVSGMAEETVDGAKFVAVQKMLLNRNPANIRKWIARFYYFRHLYFRWKRVCIAHTSGWVAHRYGQLYLHCSLISYFWVPSSCFCIVISLSEGEIIPFSGVCQSGGCIIHAGGGGNQTHWREWLAGCATDDDQRQHHHAEYRFSALASANSFVYFASSAATSRWRPRQ